MTNDIGIILVMIYYSPSKKPKGLKEQMFGMSIDEFLIKDYTINKIVNAFATLGELLLN